MNFSGYLLDFKGQECFAHKVKHDNKVKWNGAVWTSTVKKKYFDFNIVQGTQRL